MSPRWACLFIGKVGQVCDMSRLTLPTASTRSRLYTGEAARGRGVSTPDAGLCPSPSPSGHLHPRREVAPSLLWHSTAEPAGGWGWVPLRRHLHFPSRPAPARPRAVAAEALGRQGWAQAVRAPRGEVVGCVVSGQRCRPSADNYTAYCLPRGVQWHGRPGGVARAQQEVR